MTDDDRTDAVGDDLTGDVDDECPPSDEVVDLVLTPTIRGGEVLALWPTMRGGCLGSGGLLVTTPCSEAVGVDVVYSPVVWKWFERLGVDSLLMMLLLVVTGRRL